jgi:hypothetical protein
VRAAIIIVRAQNYNSMLAVYTVWGEKSTTEHAAVINTTVWNSVVPHFFNSTQHVVKVATIIGVAYKCNSVSGTETVWRDTYFSKHAATNIVTACCTFITHCYKSAQHVVKVATIVSMANKSNSVSGFFNSVARYLINMACCHE